MPDCDTVTDAVQLPTGFTAHVANIGIKDDTTDFCVMQGRYPTEEDQRTLTKAGDSVDELLSKLIGERHPGVQFTIHMVRGWKEQHGFIGEAPAKVLVSAPSHGKATQIDITEELKAGAFNIFDTLRKLHPVLKDQHFLNPKEEDDDPYESTQITALIANEHGIFGVYSMREVFEYTQFWAVGSGREFALGAMHALYPRLKTAEAIARAGIDAGATFDRNSSMPMSLHRLKARG